MRRRRQRRRLDPIRSIGLRGGFDSIADGFGSLSEGMDGLMGVDVEDPGDGNGRWVFKRKQPHDCVLPNYKDATWGDVWQCGVCGAQWQVTNDDYGTVRMVRTAASSSWYSGHGHTTGTGGYYGYTWTNSGPFWYSSETRTEERPPSDDGENP